MKDFFKNFTEILNYIKSYKISVITLKTPIIDFSFAPSIIPQPSFEGCFAFQQNYLYFFGKNGHNK